MSFEPNKPFVVSGKLYLKTLSSQFVFNIGTNKKEVFNFNKNGIVKVNGVQEPDVMWQPGGWIWFSAYVPPGENVSQTKMHLLPGGNIR